MTETTKMIARETAERVAAYEREEGFERDDAFKTTQDVRDYARDFGWADETDADLCALSDDEYAEFEAEVTDMVIGMLFGSPAPTPTRDYRAEVEATMERTRRVMADRARRIADCEVEATDCALSIMADRETLSLCERQMEILDAGGFAWLPDYRTLDGEEVEWAWVDTRYGRKLVVDMPDGSTVWTTACTAKGLAKRGIKRVRALVPAWARLRSNGSSIASGCYVETYPAQLNRATGVYSERPQAVAVEDWDWSE